MITFYLVSIYLVIITQQQTNTTSQSTASTDISISCSSLTDQTQCDQGANCTWNSNSNTCLDYDLNTCQLNTQLSTCVKISKCDWNYYQSSCYKTSCSNSVTFLDCLKSKKCSWDQYRCVDKIQKDCSSITEVMACNLVESCIYNSQCVELICSAILNKQDCKKEQGCSLYYYEPQGKFQCTLLKCMYLNSWDECNSVNDCIWNGYNCISASNNCFGLTSAQVCDQSVQCSWYSKSNVCLRLSCEYLQNQRQCDFYSKCIWDYSKLVCKKMDGCKTVAQRVTCDRLSKCLWSGTGCINKVCSQLSFSECKNSLSCTYDEIKKTCSYLNCFYLSDASNSVSSIEFIDHPYACPNQGTCLWQDGYCQNADCSLFLTKQDCNYKGLCGWNTVWQQCQEYNCSSYDSNDTCIQIVPCYWTESGGCKKKNCDSLLNESTCDEDPFCYWEDSCKILDCSTSCNTKKCNMNYVDQICEDLDCNHGSFEECNYRSSCQWTYGQGCSQLQCTSRQLEQCARQTKCYWNDKAKSCQNQNCFQISSESNCQQESRCRWNSTFQMCENLNCAYISDQANCDKQTYCQWDALSQLCSYLVCQGDYKSCQSKSKCKATNNQDCQLDLSLLAAYYGISKRDQITNSVGNSVTAEETEEESSEETTTEEEESSTTPNIQTPNVQISSISSSNLLIVITLQYLFIF